MRPKETEPVTDIIKMYTNGRSISNIRKTLSIGIDKVKRVLLLHGYKITRPPNHFKGFTKKTSEVLLKRGNNLSRRYKTGELIGSWKGKKHTQIEKRKISEKMKGNKNATHRVDRQNYYNNIRMDSKWEIGVAKYFDRNNITWAYNKQGFILSDGRHYFPDFFIYENNNLIMLIEVKGLFRLKNKQKFEQFKSEYQDIIIELWDRNKLYKLGIIDINGYTI